MIKVNKKFSLIFSLLIIHCARVALFAPLLITNCVSQWLQQTSGVTTSLLDIDFINQNTGWACGDGGVILKTTNGGLNWFAQNSSVLNRLEGIDAIDASTIYCVGWLNTILKSTNGGTDWLIIRADATGGPRFFKTFFLNQNTGWLLRSGGGYVLRTTDGCASFDSTFTNNSFNRDIYFKDALTGVLCGDGAWVMRSTDGGVIWNQINVPLYQGGMPNFYRLSFVGNNAGWTIGEGSASGLGKLVYRTTNFGSNWDTIGRVPYPDGQLNYSVFFSSLNTGYAGGTTGYIFKSTNSGFNWIQQVISGGGFRRDFNFVNDTVGWVVGGGGQIFKTTTGGQFVGIEPISSIVPKDFNLYQNYPNPFNPVTAIEFEIPVYEHIRLSVFDLLGKEVSVLLNDKLKPGKYRVIFEGSSFSSGIYFYQIKTHDLIISKKMILIK